MGFKYYAVHQGRYTGIFNSWAECKKQIDGFPYSVHKGFNDLNGAHEFVKHGRDTTTNKNNEIHTNENPHAHVSIKNMLMQNKKKKT